MALDYQKLLDDAEMKLHALMTGQSIVEIRDQNGEMVRYSSANSVKLQSYILWLKMQLGQPVVVAPMRAYF